MKIYFQRHLMVFVGICTLISGISRVMSPSVLTLSLPTGNGIMKIQKITLLYLETDLEGFWTLEKVL